MAGVPPQYASALAPLQAAGGAQPMGAAIAVGDPMTPNELLAAEVDVARFALVGGDALHQAKKRKIAVEMMQGQSLMPVPVNLQPIMQQLHHIQNTMATSAQLDNLAQRVDNLTARLEARHDNTFIRAFNKAALENGRDLRPLVREEPLPNPNPNPGLAAIGGQAPAVGAAPPLLANGAHGFPQNEIQLQQLQAAQFHQLERWYGLAQDFFGAEQPQQRARFRQWITIGPIW